VQRATRTALVGAVAAASGVVVLRVVAFRVPAAHHADAAALQGFLSLDRPRIHPLALALARVADPLPYGLLGLFLVGVALARGRLRTAAAAAVVLLGATVSTDYVLRPALAAPRWASELGTAQMANASFPSGHATASMALALCAILVAPRGLRPLAAAVGAGFAIAVSYALLSLGWHYPSDVVGGYLVAASWAGAAVAALRAAEARWPERPGRRAPGWVFSRAESGALACTLAGLALAMAASVAAWAPDRALHFVRLHTIFVIGAGLIALAGLAVAGVVAASMREASER
jgi:membrane-associated phospholipid phosphatase